MSTGHSVLIPVSKESAVETDSLTYFLIQDVQPLGSMTHVFYC